MVDNRILAMFNRPRYPMLHNRLTGIHTENAYGHVARVIAWGLPPFVCFLERVPKAQHDHRITLW